jgi:hypothetical protein
MAEVSKQPHAKHDVISVGIRQRIAETWRRCIESDIFFEQGHTIIELGNLLEYIVQGISKTTTALGGIEVSTDAAFLCFFLGIVAMVKM